MSTSRINKENALLSKKTSDLTWLSSTSSSYSTTSVGTQSTSKSNGEIVEGTESKTTKSRPSRNRLFRSANSHFPSEESTEPLVVRHTPNLPEENLHNLLDGYQVKALNPKIQNALVTIQQQLLSLEKFDEPRSVYQRPEMDEISAESPRPVTPNPPTPPSLPSLSPPSQIAAPLSSTPPSRPLAQVPTEMDYPDVGEEEDPLQTHLIDFPHNDRPMVLEERECGEETTIEEKGKVYMMLGGPIRRTMEPPNENLENLEPKSRKRLSKTGKNIGRPLGASKLKRSAPLPEDVAVEMNDGVERICRWKDCEDRFTQERVFVSHVEAHMREDGKHKSWKCHWEGCTNTPFDAYYKIQAHIRLHTKEKPFVCTVQGCGVAYSRMEYLKVHTRTHTGEKPCRCSVCGKTFTNVRDKARHEKQVHSEKKQYQCGVETCGKSYTDPSSLRKHIRLHHPKVQ